MSVGATNWAPTALARDSFTIRRATVSAAGALYIRVLSAENAAANRYEDESSSWTASTPHATVLAETARATKAIGGGARTLEAARWPASARWLVEQLATWQLGQVRQMNAAANAPPSHRRAAAAQTGSNYTGPFSYGHEIRRALHIPEYGS